MKATSRARVLGPAPVCLREEAGMRRSTRRCKRCATRFGIGFRFGGHPPKEILRAARRDSVPTAAGRSERPNERLAHTLPQGHHLRHRLRMQSSSRLWVVAVLALLLPASARGQGSTETPQARAMSLSEALSFAHAHQPLIL